MITQVRDAVLGVSIIKLRYETNNNRGVQADSESVKVEMAEAAISKHPDVESVERTGKIADIRFEFIISLRATRSVDDANALAVKLQAIIDHCLKIEL